VLRTTVLAAVAGLVIAADWLRFEEPRSGDGRAFALVALAIVPVLLRPLWLRLAGIAVSVVLGAWVAFSVSPFAVWPGGDGYFGPLGSRFGHGLVDFYDFRLPFDPVRHPQSHQVILAAIFGFSLAVALAVAARRPLLAVVCVLVGAGWPVTLLAGGDELSRGVVILAVALALLAGLAERPSRLAFVASGAVIVGALALSSSPAVAKTAFLDWEQWDFYTRPQDPVSVRYIWDARYDGVRFPKKQTTVLTIRAPHRSNYWRATVLDQFDGTRWLERLWVESTRERLVLLPAGARDREQWLEQEVTVRALRDDHLIGATIPVGHDVDEATYDGQGVVRVPEGLERDQSYTIWSYAPRPTPSELARVRASYPRALTKPGRELDLADGITVPPLGATGRDLRLAQLLIGRLEPYSELYDRARAVAGETSSPYAAVIALETWFRTTGGFTYSEQPGSTPGLPPLVAFVEDTKTGYCQHFAGAMAVMLRLLGVPARVAAGFVPGKYRDGTWRVTDHEAHAWVEVWFRGYGWLPFDPTPGRGRVSGSYSSTSLGFNAEAAARLLAGLVRGGELFGGGNPPGAAGPPSPERLSARDTPFGIGAAVPAAQERDTPSLILFLLLLSAGVAAAIVLLKQARRRLRYLTRDPRRIAAACGRELTEFLQDQRLATSRAATFHELGDAIADRLGVDARRFARVATAARYGPPDDAHGAARRARRELRLLKGLLRGNLLMRDRVRGLVSVRSLGLG
jgi:transglutaminase-like putative cysteine protease